MIPWLGVRDAFPPVTKALRNPNGLLAAGADLSTQRLLDAYARGIFPGSAKTTRCSGGVPIHAWSSGSASCMFTIAARTIRARATR